VPDAGIFLRQDVKQEAPDELVERRVGPQELLFVTRERAGVSPHLRGPHNCAGGATKHDYYVSNAPADTPLAELARAAKAEHRIEECLQRAKSEAGLSDYEVRTWAGWHHRHALVFAAVWFLALEARRGKKGDGRDHRAADAGVDRVGAA
jgi:SRSO17 transposase